MSEEGLRKGVRRLVIGLIIPMVWWFFWLVFFSTTGSAGAQALGTSGSLSISIITWVVSFIAFIIMLSGLILIVKNT